MISRFLVIISAFLLLCGSGNAGKLDIETAYGFGSFHLPFSSKWEPTVKDGGLIFREYALRATYNSHRYVSFSLAAGWVNDRKKIGIGYMPVADKKTLTQAVSNNNARNVYYLLPSINLKTKIIRLNLGSFVYTVDYGNGESWPKSYNIPFNSDDNIEPSIGIELGEPDLYIIGKYYASFPIFSGGGGLEIGLGTQTKNEYEHKIYYGTSDNFYAIGYRGEFRVKGNLGIIAGLAWGNARYDWSDNEYIFMIGIKFAGQKPRSSEFF